MVRARYADAVIYLKEKSLAAQASLRSTIRRATGEQGRSVRIGNIAFHKALPEKGGVDVSDRAPDNGIHGSTHDILPSHTHRNNEVRPPHLARARHPCLG
jgi:hypothetical protein